MSTRIGQIIPHPSGGNPCPWSSGGTDENQGGREAISQETDHRGPARPVTAIGVTQGELKGRQRPAEGRGTRDYLGGRACYV